MKKILTFAAAIAAPKAVVWETMLGGETYGEWTSPFCEGSYYEGSWDQGSRICFMTPGGDGMVAEIAANRPFEHVSIRHLGEIRDGVEDTTSEQVRAWAPAYENYSLAATEDGTEVTVELETLPEYEQFLAETYPKALEILRKLCEARQGTA